MRKLIDKLWERTTHASWYMKTHVSHDNPIIIGGCARSGTTLMRVMLDTHPNIFCGPETTLLYRRTFPHRKIVKLSKKYGLTEQDLRELIKNTQSYFEFVEKYFNILKEKEGKQRWGEKSPVNVRHITRIFKHFPNATFIHMIRDGRDTVASLRTFPKYNTVNGERIELHTNNPINECIERWIKDVSKGLEWRTDPRYIEIKYEDLIENDESTLKTLFKFIGEPWDSNVRKYYNIKKPSREEAQNPGVTKPIYKSAIGRWKNEFSTEDIELFKSKANKLMIKLGYVTDPD